MTDIHKLIKNLELNPPITNKEFGKCEDDLLKKIPKEYLDFFRIGNGGDGFVGENSYIILWQCEELEAMNKAYKVDEYAPGLFIFGSDGGGEAFGFDTREADIIVQIPFVGMDWKYAKKCGKSFFDFLVWLADRD